MMSDNFYINFMHINFFNLVLIDYLSLLLVLTSFIYFQFSITKNVANKSILNRTSLSLANILLFFSIIGLIVQPEFESYANDQLDEVRVITKSSNTEFNSVISDLEDNRENTLILLYELETLSKVYDFSRLTSNLIFSPSQLPIRISDKLGREQNGNYSLKVVGDGFTEQQIEVLNKNTDNHLNKISYEPPTKIANGIINPNWDNRINLGEYSNFTAKIQIVNQLGAQSKLNEKAIKERYTVRLLNHTGQVEEEKSVVEGTIVSFKMSPKTFGLVTYKIELLNNNSVMSKEQIAIEVRNRAILKMLILQSSPSFETKQIKNWAGEHHAVVVVKTSINPTMNLSRLINVKEKNINKYKSMKIDESILGEFDVLIIDSRRFNQLNRNEINAITNSIDDGLGVIVLMDKKSSEKPLPLAGIDREGFTINKIGKKNQSILYIDSFNSNDLATRDLISELPISHIANNFQFASKLEAEGVDKNRLTTLISNSKEDVLVAQQQRGLGAVTYNLLKDTYRWISNGEKIPHSHFWQHLIKNTARNRKNIIEWAKDDERFVVGKKEQLCVITSMFNSDSNILEIKSFSDNKFSKALFNKTSTLENLSCADFWAETHGWHQLKLNSEYLHQDLFFYVYPKYSWLADNQNSKMISTLRFKNQLNNRPITKTSKIELRYREIELWVYWMLIITSLSYIWIERKCSE
jgi:hypothetical protein